MPNTVETVITLEESKYKKLKNIAKGKRASVSQLIEETIDDILSELSLPADNDTTSRDSKNPLLDIIGICNTGLRDASVNHDKYLYAKDAL